MFKAPVFWIQDHENASEGIAMAAIERNYNGVESIGRNYNEPFAGFVECRGLLADRC